MAYEFKKIVSSSGKNFIFRIFGLGASFLITMIISRFYGVDVFGSYSVAFTIAQASAMVFALGIPNALIKISGTKNLSYDHTKRLLVTGLKTALLFSIVPVVFFAAGAKFLAINVFGNKELTDYFFILSACLPVLIAHEIFLYFYIATKQFSRYNLFMFFIPNIFLVFLLFAFYHFNCPHYFSLLAFVISIIVVVITEVVTIFSLSPVKITPVISAGELIKTASPMMFSGLMLYLLNWTDIIMLGIMMDEYSVGIYNIAFKIGSAGFLIIVSVSTIITPKMAELFGEGKHEDFKSLIQSSTRLIAILSLPLVVCLILFGPYILSLFNEESVAGSTALIIVSIGVLFSAVCGNVDQILNITDNAAVFRDITIGCFLLNTILNYFLIKLYGINGAAAASLITNVVVNTVSVIIIKRKLGFYTFA